MRTRQQGDVQRWATWQQRVEFQAEVRRARDLGRIDDEEAHRLMAWIDNRYRTILEVAAEAVILRVYNNRHEEALSRDRAA
jgi:hypothetical protein